MEAMALVSAIEEHETEKRLQISHTPKRPRFAVETIKSTTRIYQTKGLGPLMKYFVKIGEKRYEIVLNGGNSQATINGKEMTFDYRKLRDGKLHSLVADGKTYEFALEKVNGGFDIWHSSGQVHVDINDEKRERISQLAGDKRIGHKLSPSKLRCPDLYSKSKSKSGQRVEKGDGLVIVEAMKMENELKAHAAAVVKEIKVNPRQPVEKNQVLIVFESE